MWTLPSYKERPVMNSSVINMPYTPEPRSMDLRQLIWWIKKTPEAIGIIKRIATDIVTDIQFISAASQSYGRPSNKFHEDIVKKAEVFSAKNNLRQKLIALVIDWLMTGDFYLWVGSLSDDQVKEIAIRHYAEYGIELKEINSKQFYDEDYNGLNAIEVVPSSMTRIEHDENKITSFVQVSKFSPAYDRRFTPEQIIHGKFMDIDGSVYGYSPMEASYCSIRIINSIQDYNYYYFENGAKIDRAWKFMGNPNPEAIKRFREQMDQYTRLKRSHGYLILSGAEKIESESLNEIGEEMEFRQLAIHQVGRLAFAFNMPADILSAILGVDVRGTAVGSDIEDAGYNRNIEQAKLYIEELLNSQLWLPKFKVEMKFERTFRQDQIRQVQYQMQAIPVLEFFFRHKIPVTDQYIYDMLQIPNKHLVKGEMVREIEQQMPFAMKKPVEGQSQENYKNTKKLQQKPQQENNPPIGQ